MATTKHVEMYFPDVVLAVIIRYHHVNRCSLTQTLSVARQVLQMTPAPGTVSMQQCMAVGYMLSSCMPV